MSLVFLFIGLFGAASVAISAWASHQEQMSASIISALALAGVHLVVLLILVLQSKMPANLYFKAIIAGFICGICLFSGGIYLKVLIGFTLFSPLIPVGGMLLILSWLGISFIGFVKK